MFKFQSGLAYRALVFLLLLAPTYANACNLSCFILDSLRDNGNSFTAYTTLCIGGGSLGGINGADQATMTFGIASFGGTGTIIGFSPSTLVSNATMAQVNGTLFPGTSLPPNPSAFLSGTPDSATSYVIYILQSPSPYACVNSTQLCGQPAADCKNIVFTLSALPDSMVAIGVEGAGNPSGGCHQIAQPFSMANKMTIYFSPVLASWGAFHAEKFGHGVKLDWEVLSNDGLEEFKVMRSLNGMTWEEIGRVESQGAARTPQTYGYLDEVPQSGMNWYRIDHLDANGKLSQTEVRQVRIDAVQGLGWQSVTPNPTEGELDYAFSSGAQETMRLEVFSVRGKRILAKSFQAKEGRNLGRMDLSRFETGVYFVRLSGSNGVITRKVLKI